MMKLKDKMTPAELADCLGLARQTINRWVREKQWRTEAIPGVKGGRARLVVIDQPVREFLTNIPARRHLLTDNHLAESPGAYLVNEADAIWRQITETLQLMTPAEQLQLRDLLARKGLAVFLPASASPVRNNRQKKRQGNLPLFQLRRRQDAWPSRSAIKASALLIRSTLRDLPIAWTVTSSAGDCPAPVTATRSGIPTLPIPTSSSSAVA